MRKEVRAIIEFKNVTKRYHGKLTAVKNISLKIETGELVCFVGTSGSGKTTLMRMINRMNTPTKGDILVNGKNIREENVIHLRRSIGYVIQQIGLMPHMTIYDNIATVPRLLHWSEEDIAERIKVLAEKASLDERYLSCYPSELSGGQQQRAGVMRALAADQEIILMDEPFGALDPITRNNLQVFVSKLHREMGKTIVFVTHDIEEALSLSDRIVIMDKGSVIQFDIPENILLHPANDFVRNLIGEERIRQAVFDYQTIENMMIKNPVSVNRNVSLAAAAKMMKEHRVDTLFVTDDRSRLLGLVHIFNLQNEHNPHKRVEEIMEETFSVAIDTKVRDVIYYIQKLGYRNIPVVDHDMLVGLVTRAKVVDSIYNAFWSDYEPENDIIEQTDKNAG